MNASLMEWSGELMSAEHERQLAELVTEGHLSVQETDLREHSIDWWPINIKRRSSHRFLSVPGAVVWPSSTSEISRILTWAQRKHIAVTPFGGGSSVVGGAVPVANGLVLDTRKMASVLNLDEASQIVTVQAGIRGKDLESYLNARGYTLGHYPQSLELSTAGGWVATRATGTFSARYGGIEDLLQGMRVVLATGEVLDLAATPRSSTGPDLKELFLGSEGTLGIVADLDLRIQRLPESRRFHAVVFKDLFEGLEAIRQIVQAGLAPAVVRLYDSFESIRMHPVGEFRGMNLLIIGWDGPSDVVALQEMASLDVCNRFGSADRGSEPAEYWYQNRFDVSGLREANYQAGRLVDTIEIAVLWKDAKAMYEALTQAPKKYSTEVRAHFSHVYTTGTSLYLIFFIEAAHDNELEEKYFRAWSDVMEATVNLGGSISHHHGIGKMRIPWMKDEHGAALNVMRDLKKLLDPSGILNPGKLIPG